MIKLKRVVTDKGFILEEINSDKVNKELIDDGEVEPVDLPHVENNPESVQDHIDDIKEIIDDENKENEKTALETKTKDFIVESNLNESKLFKNRADMSEFIVKLKEQKIRHRVLPLHEDEEGYKFELKYEKPLNDELNESYETAFEVCEDGSKVSAVGSFKHTKNYTHELVDFECSQGSGSGDYRWMNRPWERFTFAEALREAMINAGVDEKCAKDCIENSYSLKSAIKYFAEHCCKKEEAKPEECLKESKDDVTYVVFTANSLDSGWKVNEIFNSKEESLDYAKDIADDYELLQVFMIPNFDENLFANNLNGLQFAEIMPHDAKMLWDKDWVQESLKEDKDEDAETEVEEPKEDAKEPKLETFDEQMDFLAKDEQEAIDGYEKVLELVDDDFVKEQLTKILEEERAHKEYLEKVKEDKTLEYSHEHKEEEPKEEPVDDDEFDNFGFEDEVDIDVEEDDFDWEPSLDESIEEEKEEEKEKEEENKVNEWDDLED